MKVDQLRSLYLDYFQANKHKKFASDSLVPKNDPTLLFTGAGMNQFKEYFLGLKTDVKRATSCQKCIRTADLENVGKTAYHQTFFEMLGNFSFGDYFKEEAIDFAWKFVTKELALPKDGLWVSVYLDDDEAFQIWNKKVQINEKRIMRFGAEDNFWPANAPTKGPNGPCGPCSEIYFGEKPGEGVEIWNLVFTEFDRQSDGLLNPLPQKNIDTGMGLERLAAVMQGVSSNYEIDLFVSLQKAIDELLDVPVLSTTDTAIRCIILDHLRSIVFSMTDGVIPSNEGRGYVIRKLIRRCVFQLRTLQIKDPVLHQMVPAVSQVMGSVYPELNGSVASVKMMVEKEEEAIWSILENRVPEARVKIRAIALMAKEGQEEQASQEATRKAFEYYDTYGVPREVLEEILLENNLRMDVEQFTSLMEGQRQRSRTKSNISVDIFSVESNGLNVELNSKTEFLGYHQLQTEAKVVGLYVDGASVERIEKGQSGICILNQTPFYAEQGGQVGDLGVLVTPRGEITVIDTQWNDKLVLHSIEANHSDIRLNENITAIVDEERRLNITKNHTATHLLHSALRKVLGDHVKQRGSLVAPDRLRFDFSHFKSLKQNEVVEVENLVNAEIKKEIDLETQIKDTKEAIAEGAMAFFGEKYESDVRVVSVGNFSKELCGGTHVKNSSHIERFRIVSESSIQSGVRRIEAITGSAAIQYERGMQEELDDLLSHMMVDEAQLIPAINSGLEEVKDYQRKIKNILQKKYEQYLLEKFNSKNSSQVILIEKFNGIEVSMLKSIANKLRVKLDPCILVLSVISDEKPQILVAVSEGLIQKGIHAGSLVKEFSQFLGGNGGGKSDLALGGGKKGSDIDKAMDLATKKIEQLMESV